jgi:hypothetical protein
MTSLQRFQIVELIPGDVEIASKGCGFLLFANGTSAIFLRVCLIDIGSG